MEALYSSNRPNISMDSSQNSRKVSNFDLETVKAQLWDWSRRFSTNIGLQFTSSAITASREDWCLKIREILKWITKNYNSKITQPASRSPSIDSVLWSCCFRWMGRLRTSRSWRFGRTRKIGWYGACSYPYNADFSWCTFDSQLWFLGI